MEEGYYFQIISEFLDGNFRTLKLRHKKNEFLVTFNNSELVECIRDVTNNKTVCNVSLKNYKKIIIDYIENLEKSKCYMVTVGSWNSDIKHICKTKPKAQELALNLMDRGFQTKISEFDLE